MKLKICIRKFFYLFICLILCSISYAGVSFRVSKIDNDVFYVALDFSLKDGEHISSPEGRGGSVSPRLKFENANIKRVVWPSSKILDKSTNYQGYDKSFSVYYEVFIDNVNIPINYSLSYVLCGNSCVPMILEGSLDFNKNPTLKSDEIDGIFHKDDINFLYIIFMTFIGGIILNLMPCVFPVLSLKIFSLINTKDNRELRRHALYYTGGVILSFLLIGNSLILFRYLGNNIGWGFYMQNTYFVVLLLLVFLISALYFFEVFSFRDGSITSNSRRRVFFYNEDLKSLYNGILGAFASATCVGPFIGIAISSALIFNRPIFSEIVFIILGLGVAFPIFIVSFFPGFRRFMPRPGEWMNIIKKIMGFLMLISCVWPIYILSMKKDFSISYLLIGLIFISMIFYIIEIIKNNVNSKIIRRFSVYFLYIFIISVCYCIAFYIDDHNIHNNIEDRGDRIEWHSSISYEKLMELKGKGIPIFLNFTASWCLTCQMNESVFNNKQVIEILKKKNVYCVKLDWTNHNDEMSKLLETHGSVSVPFYVYYPSSKNKDYIVLDSLLTADKIINTLSNN